MRKAIPVTDPETGFIYPSMQQYGVAVGLGPTAISKRKCIGKLSPEMVVFPGNLKNIPARDHKGRNFESITAMCRHWKICPETFRYRRFVLGWDLKDALTKARKSGKHPLNITLDGQIFTSYSQLAAYLKIKKSTLTSRIYNGWTPEELQLPADCKGPKRQKKEFS